MYSNLKHFNVPRNVPEPEYYYSSSNESLPVEEQIDSEYVPTENDIREYAIENLGMILPEDEAFLYLAREGITAPLPPNWMAYERNDGEVYYKHRITQEKTYDHPTDIEYRKKYEELKYNMARKNLKSTTAKSSNQLFGQKNLTGIGQPFNPYPSKNVAPLNMFQQQSSQLPDSYLKPNSKLQQYLSQYLYYFYQKLKTDWKQFEYYYLSQHQIRIARAKYYYEKTLYSLFRKEDYHNDLEQKIRNNKNNLKSKLEHTCNEMNNYYLRELEKTLENNFKYYKAVLLDGLEIKIGKYRAEKTALLEARIQKHRETIDRLNRISYNKRNERYYLLQHAKEYLYYNYNYYIQSALNSALYEYISHVCEEYADKLRYHNNTLDKYYFEIKKVLGHDMGSYLSDLATRKMRIKSISEQRLLSTKNKEIKQLEDKMMEEYEVAVRELKARYIENYGYELSAVQRAYYKNLEKKKQAIDKYLSLQVYNRLAEIYNDSVSRINQYQNQMNKKIIGIQSMFIQYMQDKSTKMSSVYGRLYIKKVENMLYDKYQLLNSLRRQLELYRGTLKVLQVQKEIKSTPKYQIDNLLFGLLKYFNIVHRSEIYRRTHEKLYYHRTQYKQDKQLLSSLMLSLQSYQSKSLAHSSTPTSNLSLLKQYNNDVRIMRENYQMLNRLEIVLKKLEINDPEAIEIVTNHSYQFYYKPIEVRKDIEAGRPFSTKEKVLDNLHEIKYLMASSTDYSRNTITDKLKYHSKFLQSMRSYLNRKLYQVRSNSYYDY